MQLVVQQILEQRIPLRTAPGVLTLVARDGINHPALDIEQGGNRVIVNGLDHGLAPCRLFFSQ
ncbi:hypothetical protein D3C84_1089430 [compost metagenome]